MSVYQRLASRFCCDKRFLDVGGGGGGGGGVGVLCKNVSQMLATIDSH